jgi:thioesterase domain-containing protein
VHPALGVAWSYTALLPHLDPERPLYGLQNPALSGGPRLQSVPDLAAYYLQQVREVQPEGPYHLIGWSLGGSIAHEMAVQLREQGHRVETLMLLDSYVIPGRPELDVTPSVGELLAEFGFGDGEPTGDRDGDRDGDIGIAEATEIIRATEGPLAHLSTPDLESLYEAYVAATAVAREWTPRVYDGGVLFVTAAEDPPAGRPAVDDWRHHVTGDIAHTVAYCRHSQMLDGEHVHPVAGSLGDHLATLDERTNHDQPIR